MSRVRGREAQNALLLCLTSATAFHFLRFKVEPKDQPGSLEVHLSLAHRTALEKWLKPSIFSYKNEN